MAMNAADARLLRWLDMEIRTGTTTVSVPAELLVDTTEEGRLEARRLARLSGVRILVDA